jgi:hypothetical protein
MVGHRVADREGERLIVGTAVTVLDAEKHGVIAQVGRRRVPGNQASVRVHSHAARTADQPIAQSVVVRIASSGSVGVRHAGESFDVRD